MFSVLSHPVSVALRRSSHYSNPPLLHKDHADPRLPPPVHPRFDARTFPMDLSYKIKSLTLLSWSPLLGAEGPACSLQNDARPKRIPSGLVVCRGKPLAVFIPETVPVRYSLSSCSP
ncbi:hypothetical protein CgunFtcFv8_001105 [Champsocephalus gunnari]|uniref:Uncharacterized protein n=1 Tax=Champsocephalus gunnari TaxID=52237 RepID=A0AAN8DQ59_CHAGU|nr:hypothetical protein CgunFtcFv8_001105 [Champsocephalus gunnari]